MSRHRNLTWTTTPPSQRELRKAGYTVESFAELRHRLIEPARNTTAKRLTLDNAAVALLRMFDDNPKLAILGVPTQTAGDLADIYSFLVEPAFRRDVTLLLGVDREIGDLRASQFVAPDMGYPWTLERLIYMAGRYRSVGRSDGLPPLTPIEDQLYRAMRTAGMTPRVQYGIGRYRVDFAFPPERLAVEADGRGWHDAERDARRDEHLRRLGWEVIRFSGSRIYRDVAAVVRDVAGALEPRQAALTYSDLPLQTEHRSWWRRLLDWLRWHRLANRRSSSTVDSASGEPRSVPAWKMSLDGDQRRAVEADEGVVQVIAPAGSGKTTTMIARVQELLARGVAANRILCTTFNKAAATELTDRLLRLGITGVEVRSFHALGYSILKKERLLRAPRVQTVSYGPWRKLATDAMKAVGDGGVWLDAPVASAAVSDYKLAKMWDVSTAQRSAKTAVERTAAEIYRRYEEHLEGIDRNDFDDLIVLPVRFLRSDADARQRWQGKWDCVLVDEYQDIEPAQELLVRLVAAPEDSIFAVGDEDQCIYSWRRASVERSVLLDTVYPGLERIVLATSYRCPQAISEAAARLIGHNVRRFPKEMRPNPGALGAGEIEFLQANGLEAAAEIVAELLADVDDPKGIAVLARTSRLLREVVGACAQKGVKVQAPPQALQATDAERTVLAFLRVAQTPRTATPEDVRQSFRAPNRYLPEGAEVAVATALRNGRSHQAAVAGVPLAASDAWRAPGMDEWALLCAALAATDSAARALAILRTDGRLDSHYSSVEQMSPNDKTEMDALTALGTAAADKKSAEFITWLVTRTVNLAAAVDEDGIELEHDPWCQGKGMGHGRAVRSRQRPASTQPIYSRGEDRPGT